MTVAKSTTIKLIVIELAVTGLFQSDKTIISLNNFQLKRGELAAFTLFRTFWLTAGWHSG